MGLEEITNIGKGINMAVRPVFFIDFNNSRIQEIELEFQWYSGFAKSQSQKSIKSFHAAIHDKYPELSVLEISSKSENPLGVALSAFNLSFITKKYQREITVETAFQGSKVFESGGPYLDLYGLDSRTAKKDVRLYESGKLIGFNFFGKSFPLEPKTLFYDWIYINALRQHNELSNDIKKYHAFTDIAFNPEKSINCQARSAALYVYLENKKLIEQALTSAEDFKNMVTPLYMSRI